MWHLLLHLIRPLVAAANEGAAGEREEHFVNVVDPRKFMATLHKMGYFQYADPQKIPMLEKTLMDSLAINHGLETIVDPNSQIPYDYRLYSLSAKDLAERGGINTALKPLKKTFDKLMMPVLWTDESITVSNNKMDHHVSLNGKRYNIYKGAADSPKKTGIMKMNVVDMLNDQLKISRVEERIYLISSVNDGQAVFLTKKMHSYISDKIKSKFVKPMDTKMWGMWNQLI